MSVTGILLAAGKGSRFGGDKLLHPLANGTPMGVQSARRLQVGCDHVIAVVKPHDDLLAELLTQEGCKVVVCAAAGGGMGHSLAAGVRAAAQAEAWIAALGDMPYILPSTYQALRDALSGGAALAAPTYREQRGHPVGFSRPWFDALAALKGDQGARSIIQHHLDRMVLCPVADAGILHDIDHPVDIRPSHVA